MKRPSAGGPGDYALAADYAYAMLRRGIEDGTFGPGARMREIDLATRLGVSRTPIRQALSRLEVEGMLTVAPRTGLVVASLDSDAMTELYNMREVLEGAAAVFAARNASPKEISDLERILDETPSIAGDPREFARHNRRLHQAIYDAAHNRFLVKSLQALHDAMLLLGPTTLSTKARRKEAHEEHRALIAAIADRDGEAATAVVRQHIQAALKVRLAKSDAPAKEEA